MPGSGHLHTTEFIPPFIESGVRDAMLAAQVHHRQAGFGVFQDGNDFLSGKTGLAHVGSFEPSSWLIFEILTEIKVNNN